MADYSGASYSDYYPPKLTAAELEARAASARRREAFPNVGYGEGEDSVKHEYGIRHIASGMIMDLPRDGLSFFNPYTGRFPEGFEVISRTLWPEPWEVVK